MSFSGLTDTEQYTLFDDTRGPGNDEADTTATDTESAPPGVVSVQKGDPASPEWSTGTDVVHAGHGHGWVQGAGHGVVTVRFETSATGPGRAVTFAADGTELRRADPLDSLVWD